MLLLLLSKFVFLQNLAFTTKMWPTTQLSSKRDFLSLGHFRSSIKTQRFERVDLTIPHDSVGIRGTWLYIYKALFLICSWYCNKTFHKRPTLNNKKTCGPFDWITALTDRLFDSKWFWKVLGFSPFTSTTPSRIISLHHLHRRVRMKFSEDLRVQYDNQKMTCL